MNKKNIFLSAFLLTTLSISAQETYDNANIATEDLNGTARYVGMGGAMEALGADISTMSTNPAGIGLMRHATAGFSASVINQQDAENFDFAKKTKLSFDQLGFVYAHPTGRGSYLNFGFNYRKSRNFSNILRAASKMNGASLNKLSYAKGYEGVFEPDMSNDNEVIGYEGSSDNASYAFTQLDYLLYNAILHEEDQEGDLYFYNDASDFALDRGTKGYIGEYDFNISGNIHDRVFLGLTIGVKDVNYRHYGLYTETLVDGMGASVGPVSIGDDRRIDGQGFDIKAGIIFRPVETSPFRIGLYVNTPTWYDLTTENYTTLDNRSQVGLYDSGKSEEVYDFKMYTPWKFGVSLGHTIGSSLALGATYEFADYSSVDSRVITGSSYDWYYDSYVDDSDHDVAMNDHTSRTLKGVSTLKLGAEYRPDNDIYVRFGYNYVSPMYKMEGYKDGTLISPGSYYASTADFTNWKATNRFTCGLGYNVGKLSLDLAYQYSVQNGEFSPFMSYTAPGGATDITDNIAPCVEVSNKRHQLLLSMTYHF